MTSLVLGVALMSFSGDGAKARVALAAPTANVRVAQTTLVSGIDNVPAGSAVTVRLNGGPERPVELRSTCSVGDINGDGKVDVLDVVLLSSAVVGNVTIPSRPVYVYQDTGKPLCLAPNDKAYLLIKAPPPSTASWDLTVTALAPQKAATN